MHRFEIALCGGILIAGMTPAIGASPQLVPSPPPKQVIRQPVVAPRVQQPMTLPQRVIQQSSGPKVQTAPLVHSQSLKNQVPTFSPTFQTSVHTTTPLVANHPVVGTAMPATTGRLNFAPAVSIQPNAQTSSSSFYIQSGTGARLTASQVASGTFPAGTFFISSSGQQVTPQQIQASLSGSTSISAAPRLPNTGNNLGAVGTGNANAPLYSALPPARSSGIANSTPATMPMQIHSLTNSGTGTSAQNSRQTSISQIAAKAQTAPIPGCSTSPGVVCMSPNLAVVPTNTNDCVYFLSKDLGIKLPTGLYTYADKVNHINVTLSQTPKAGDVAVIAVTNPTDKPYGHVAEVTNVSANSITVLEANYHIDPATRQGIVDSRISTAANLQQAEQQLNIVGFIRPSSY